MDQIVVKDLVKSFPRPEGGRKVALSDVNLTISQGEFVVLLGPSGCGKTTLLNILANLETADEGEVRIATTDGNELTVSYMFQESRLLPWLTVYENLSFVLDGDRRRAGTRIRQWLERVGLGDVANYYPWQLSVGMQQRVAVARALIIGPDILFMDEPFSSLDELTAMSMRDELLDLWHELSCTVVMVTHNPLEAVLLADRVIVMTPSPGKIVDVMPLATQLPRPRDPDDPELWKLSRLAVRRLTGAPENAHT